LIKIKEWITKNDPGATLIPFSGAMEFKLVDMPEDETAGYLKEVGATRLVRLYFLLIQSKTVASATQLQLLLN